MQPKNLHIYVDVPPTAHEALLALEEAGFESWFVGGCVRDALLERPVHDFDIATAALWEEASRVLMQRGFAIHETGTQHGTITAVKDGLALEITTFRSDGTYSDGRHPDSVQFSQTIEEDLLRRDFTINALAYNPNRGVLDIVGGYEDLLNKQLRAVGNPATRFDEDALRILRGLRLMSELGFSLEAETYEAMQVCKIKLLKVSTERIVIELNRLLCGAYVHDALMASIDVIGPILPEIVACKNFEQKTPYHIYDVWEHICWTVHYAPATVLERWAALLHDIGKPAVFFEENGRGHFYGHAKVSVVLAQCMLERLGFSASFILQVVTLIRFHDFPIETTPKGVKRMLAKLDGNAELFEALLALKRADIEAHSDYGKATIEICDELQAIYEEILAIDEAFSLKHLAISGTDILALGVPEGPIVGVLLHDALDAVIDEQIGNNKAELLTYIQEKL